VLSVVYKNGAEISLQECSLALDEQPMSNSLVLLSSSLKIMHMPSLTDNEVWCHASVCGHTGMRGTPAYIAPELVDLNKLAPACDGRY
jgi:hypothetical protein